LLSISCNTANFSCALHFLCMKKLPLEQQVFIISPVYFKGSLSPAGTVFLHTMSEYNESYHSH
ncbi:hypothetical protein, partial [Brevibacillus laterosporus]|uniref:hypothetical protein n=1 Tax=Brevibacillus laterosporus TaxID=1465 RepID=UPI001CA5BE25